MVDAAYEAYEDASLGPADVQAAWLSTYYSGITGQMLAEALKLTYIPVTRIENACASASDALRNACYAVISGACDIALVLGVEKLKDNGYSGLPDSEWWVRRDNTYRDQSMTAPGRYALMATRYFFHYGLQRAEGKTLLAQIAVKNHYNGSLHPKAHFQQKITLEQAVNAPLIAWPLGLFDCCGVSDGASAAMVTRSDLAKRFRPDPVYVKALQISTGPREGFMNPAYDWAHVEETTRAAAAAYKQAGLANPRREISLIELHDCFSITELVTYEDLQLSPRGKAREDVESGFFSLQGQLPVNSDGGLTCFGHPIGASGLRMMYEVYKQLQGKAGPRQVNNPRLGLTHNLGGTPGSATASVIIAGL
jgi:acetyl-CoA C-acetyltransferase